MWFYRKIKEKNKLMKNNFFYTTILNNKGTIMNSHDYTVFTILLLLGIIIL